MTSSILPKHARMLTQHFLKIYFDISNVELVYIIKESKMNYLMTSSILPRIDFQKYLFFKNCRVSIIIKEMNEYNKRESMENQKNVF